jgi:hypothetical protein
MVIFSAKLIFSCCHLISPCPSLFAKWVSGKLVEKNKKIRLAAAKRTIARLESEQRN